jgi:hypothetical protein
LKKSLEALAKNNYKSTDVLLDAAKSQQDGRPAFTLDALKSDDDDPANTPVDYDIQLRESLRIMGDWLSLDKQLTPADSATKVAESNPPAAPDTNNTDAAPIKPATATP